MTVPAQRGGLPAGTGDSTVLGMVLDGVREVRDSVHRLQSDMASRFDGLDAKYMRSTEIVSRFEESLRDRTELRTQLATAVTKHDTDVIRLGAQIEAAEEKRLQDRKWAIGATLSALALLLTLVGILVAATQH